jgi:hypothetical protein
MSLPSSSEFAAGKYVKPPKICTSTNINSPCGRRIQPVLALLFSRNVRSGRNFRASFGYFALGRKFPTTESTQKLCTLGHRRERT